MEIESFEGSGFQKNVWSVLLSCSPWRGGEQIAGEAPSCTLGPRASLQHTDNKAENNIWAWAGILKLSEAM